MTRTLLTLAAFSLVATAGMAAPCRDAKGKFIKCPTASTAAMSPAVTRDAKGKCHVASGRTKGKFTACPK